MPALTYLFIGTVWCQWKGAYVGKYFIGHRRQKMVQQTSMVLLVSFHCSLKCDFLCGSFNKAKLWYVSFLSPFLQANYGSKRFRLHSLTPPDFWSPPFLHLTLGFINGLAQESSASLLFLCPAVLHGWVKQAWLIRACLLYLLVISLIKKVLLLDGCCVSLEKKIIPCPLRLSV